MKLISTESLSNQDVRQWIQELTDYTPQKIDEVLDRRKERQRISRVESSPVP